ncbi:MAG: sugar phosphate isomerase/epimerase [Chryseolinea sp.]
MLKPWCIKGVFVIFCLLTRWACPAQDIGLELYSLREQIKIDAPAAMAKVKQMGFRQVELSGTYGLDFPVLIKLLGENDLNVVSFGADFEKLRDFPQAVADEARSYGAKFVVCFWIPHDGESFTSGDVENAAEVFNKAGRIIASNGMLLCYHPHGYEFAAYEDGTIFDYFVKKLDTRYVQFEMDVFWIKQAGQDPITLLKKYPSRWVLMHLKDRKPGTTNSSNGIADDSSNVVLGSGDVGIAEVMNQARQLGIQHFFIEDESSNSEDQIPKSLYFLKSLE